MTVFFCLLSKLLDKKGETVEPKVSIASFFAYFQGFLRKRN